MSKTDEEPWCFKWIGWDGWVNGSLGGVKYRSLDCANNLMIMITYDFFCCP